MSEASSDPRDRFRQLPERVRPEEVVETSDADPPLVVEGEMAEVWRTTLFGPGTP